MQQRTLTLVSLVSLAGVLSACGGSDGPQVEANVAPSFLKGAVRSQTYDGSSDDLLTAGLGASGLAGASPAFANPAGPTAAELRKAAIWTNYRAVLDIDAKGGYGTLYGPNVNRDGVVTTGSGKIAGKEFIAYADDGSGQQNVVLMVQVPDSFDAKNPCIVTGTSSGSRGVYGAIGSSGEWGLKRGCAVAYTDKGTGNGFHDVQSNKATLIDGTTADAASAGIAAHFRAAVTDAARSAYNALFPNRVAYKHAHSQLNPEKEWGKNTLQAVEFAFYVLNEQFGTLVNGVRNTDITPTNTLVIAVSRAPSRGSYSFGKTTGSAGGLKWFGLYGGHAVGSGVEISRRSREGGNPW